METKNTFQKACKKIKFHVDSKYSILETIGSGGYGVVCSAVDNTNGQRVAIKKICNVFDIPAITKRTLRELKILKHFKHDNIISIKEILRPPDDLSKFSDVYIVLDLMGSDLHHVIHSKQELSIEHTRYFLYQLLRGLKYIHSSNIIHRDLKPSNLLINKDCELKIGDFGMARSLSASPSEKKRVMTEYVATRWYRAPELMLSLHQFTKAIDIWSVGCIFAEMLGRSPLFPGSNYLNQLQLILSVVGVPTVEFMATITSEKIRNYIGRLPHKKPVSLATLYPDSSVDTIDLLGKLLVLDPNQRCSVENALKQPFLEKYHDLDDEPTCSLFSYDLECIPVERNILRQHILKEIQEYHTKRPKPKLTPVQTNFLKPFMTPSNNNIIKDGVTQNQNIVVQVDPKYETKKRKHQSIPSVIPPKKEKTVAGPENADLASLKKSLSDQDKEMLQRWQKMQKHNKPFVHPIRKHMDELKLLKTEATTVHPPAAVNSEETVKGQQIVDRVSGLQFTNFVAQNKDGLVSLVKEQTIRLPDQVQISDDVTHMTPTITATMGENKQEVKPPPPQQRKLLLHKQQPQPQTILIPLSSLPLFQMRNGPIMILPKFNAPQKVNVPVPIAPKPSVVVTLASSTQYSAPPVNKIINIKPAIPSVSKPAPFTTNIPFNITTAPTNLVSNVRLKVNNNVAVANKILNVSSRQQDSGSSGKKSGDASVYSSDSKCSALLSSNSMLSDISINSSELNSPMEYQGEQQSLLNEQKVLNKFKQLSEQERNIVNLIETLSENQPEHLKTIPQNTALFNDSQVSVNGTKDIISTCNPLARTLTSMSQSHTTLPSMSQSHSTLSSFNQSHSTLSSLNQSEVPNTVTMSSFTQSEVPVPVPLSSFNQSQGPATTLASSDANSWSIVKNMLVSTLKAKKEKEERTALFVNNNNHGIEYVNSGDKVSCNYILSTQANQINFLTNDAIATTSLIVQPVTSEVTSFLTSDSLSSVTSSALTNLTNDKSNEILRDESRTLDFFNIASNSVDPDWNNQGKIEASHDVTLINSLALEFPNHINKPPSMTKQDSTFEYSSLINKNEVGRNVLLTPFLNRVDHNFLPSTPGKTTMDDMFTIMTDSKSKLNDRQNQDVFLTTFLDTPKAPRSGAAAYGLDMNLEDLFVGSTFDVLNPIRQPNSSQLTDQTPLSASLLNDWLDVNDMEPIDVVDLQRELETTSSSLLFEN